MKKILSSFFITSLFLLFSVTPSFASSILTVSDPRVVNNDFNIDIQIYGAHDNICSWWNSLHNVYVVDLNGNRLHNFSNCGYVTTDPDGTVHYAFSGAPQPPTGTYRIEVVEQEQNNYDVISNNTFDWISTINFPPSLQAPANAVLTPGQTYSGSGSFTDADSSSWTATVNYSDGSGPQPLTLSGMNFSLNHTYAQNGGYLITITVTDEHGKIGTATAQVYVEAYDLSVSNPRLNSSGEFTIDLNVSAPDNVCSWWTVLHNAYIIDATTGQRQHDFANCSSNGGNNYTISGLGVLPAGTYKIEVLESEQPGLNGGSYDVISTNSFVWSSNQPPQFSSLNGGAINEGQIYTENGSFSDTDSTSWTATVNYSDGSSSEVFPLNPDNTFTLSHLYKDNGTYTVIVTIVDNQGAIGTRTATVTVNNVVSSVSAITASINPIQVNTSTTATATFTDTGILDTHTAVWNWGDGTTNNGTVIEANGSGSVSDNHTYTTSGVYEITLTVTDKDGGVVTQTFQYLSVYSPTPQGLFSAGQRYTSPAGAYLENPNAAGNVMFGLSYKYQGDVPVGNRQFTMDFKTANFEFNAATISSFVISNGVGTLRGAGMITNRSGEYGFLVVGEEGSDTIRIKITDPSNNNAVIYDTQPGASDTSTPTTAVIAGNVLAH